MENPYLEKLKDVIYKIVEGKDIPVEEIEGGFVLDVPVEYEDEPLRRQFVYVTSNRETTQGEEVYQVFTICAPEDERFYKSALMLNMTLPFGAIALAEVEGKNHFVIVDTYLAKDVTQAELENSIITLAEAGDKMEKVMIGEDVS